MAIQQLDIEKGYALFSKSSYQTALHRHYGIELVYCRNGTFSLVTEEKTYSKLTSVIIPSNLPHQFQCGSTECQLLFLDPLSAIGQYVNHKYLIRQKTDVLVNPSIGDLFNDEETVLTAPSKDPANHIELDSRIEKCISEIYDNLHCSELSIKQLSEVSYLSESRLSHLFKEVMGISIRQYILWNKIRHAVMQSEKGKSLTAAAHAAGFVDSSHFNKAFYNMFGTSPYFSLKS